MEDILTGIEADILSQCNLDGTNADTHRQRLSLGLSRRGVDSSGAHDDDEVGGLSGLEGVDKDTDAVEINVGGDEDGELDPLCPCFWLSFSEQTNEEAAASQCDCTPLLFPFALLANFLAALATKTRARVTKSDRTTRERGEVEDA
jgi:hypothetical protein